MAGLASGTGNKKAPLSERKDDLYETPAVAVRALLKIETLPDIIWEPACGPGAIVRELRAAGRTAIATDLVDYGCEGQESGRDFLMERSAPEGCTCVVTNPPFKLAAQFATKALDLVPSVYMLLRLAFLEAGNLQTEAGVARRVALDGGNLARVHIFRKRLPMMHRQGWEGRKANSGMAFAWFCWRRGHTGPIELRRISWEDAE